MNDRDLIISLYNIRKELDRIEKFTDFLKPEEYILLPYKILLSNGKAIFGIQKNGEKILLYQNPVDISERLLFITKDDAIAETVPISLSQKRLFFSSIYKISPLEMNKLHSVLKQIVGPGQIETYQNTIFNSLKYRDKNNSFHFVPVYKCQLN